jgi:ubiquinone/menaquinone biosynthesis C-methylase UbiE
VTDLNPQKQQMSDESMVRNLAAQAECIWPQERELLRRYTLPGAPRVLDAGCGTGEITSRLAREYPDARVLGVDILDHHLELARERHAALGDRVAFEHRSVFELGLPAGTFDLTVCRHVTQSIPHVDRVLAELVRVTKPGGWLHLVSEDYDMIHFQRRTPDVRDLWHEAPQEFSEKTGINLFVGRDTVPMLQALGLEEIRMDYVTVDTLRAPRDAMARIFEAWRDGYVESIAQLTRFTEAEATAYFDTMIATIRDPNGYAVWQVPVASARVP